MLDEFVGMVDGNMIALYRRFPGHQFLGTVARTDQAKKVIAERTGIDETKLVPTPANELGIAIKFRVFGDSPIDLPW